MSQFLAGAAGEKAAVLLTMEYLADEVALNIGAGEKLVGIEILDAREVLGAGRVPAVTLERLESTDAPLVSRFTGKAQPPASVGITSAAKGSRGRPATLNSPNRSLQLCLRQHINQ